MKGTQEKIRRLLVDLRADIRSQEYCPECFVDQSYAEQITDLLYEMDLNERKVKND